MAQKNPRKRRKVLSEEEQLRAAQLERALFGDGGDFLSRLGREEALHKEEQATAAAASLVWEDRRGGPLPRYLADSESGGEEEQGQLSGGEEGAAETDGEASGDELAAPSEEDSGSDDEPVEASSRAPQREAPEGAAGALGRSAEQGLESSQDGLSSSSDGQEEEEADEGEAERAQGRPSQHTDLRPAEDSEDEGSGDDLLLGEEGRERGGEEGGEAADGILVHTRNAQRAAAQQAGALGLAEGEGELDGAGDGPGELRPAWVDADDAELEVDIMAQARTRKLRAKPGEAVLSGAVYEQRLRQQHAKLHPRTEWAALRRPRGSAEGDLGDAGAPYDGEEGDGLLASAAPLLAQRSARLPPGALETSRLRDANHADPSRAVLGCLQFHPGGRLLLTGGLDKRLRLFRVDGVKNERVQSIFFPDLPIRSAAFIGDGAQVVVTGRRRFFFLYDLGGARLQRVPALLGRPERSLEAVVASPAAPRPLLAVLGNAGCVPLVSPGLRQVVGELRMAGTVRAAAFSPCGDRLLTAGGDGLVHTWDVRTQRCLSRHVDEGSLGVTALASGAGGTLHATGSGSGVVNLYAQDAADGAATAAKPLKAFLNLTTTVDTLAFSPDAQMLVAASRLKRDALRIVHVASRTVFANWPTSRTPLGHVHSAAFSPSGAFLAVGNAKGRALLYRMHHYPGGPHTAAGGEEDEEGFEDGL